MKLAPSKNAANKKKKKKNSAIPFHHSERTKNAGFFGRGRRGGGRVGKPRGGAPWTAQRSHRKKRPCIRHTSCTSRYCSFGKRAQPRASTPTTPSSFLPSFLPCTRIYRTPRPSSLFPLLSLPFPSLFTILLFLFPSLCVYNIYTLYTLCHFVTSRSNRCHSARIIFVAPPPSTRLLIDVTLRGTTRTSYLLSYFPHPTTSPLLPPPSLGPNE